jgi:hypothetical protein
MMKSFLLSVLFGLLLVDAIFGALIEYKFMTNFGGEQWKNRISILKT